MSSESSSHCGWPCRHSKRRWWDNAPRDDQVSVVRRLELTLHSHVVAASGQHYLGCVRTPVLVVSLRVGRERLLEEVWRRNIAEVVSGEVG